PRTAILTPSSAPRSASSARQNTVLRCGCVTVLLPAAPSPAGSGRTAGRRHRGGVALAAPDVDLTPTRPAEHIAPRAGGSGQRLVELGVGDRMRTFEA